MLSICKALAVGFRAQVARYHRRPGGFGRLKRPGPKKITFQSLQVVEQFLCTWPHLMAELGAELSPDIEPLA